ncbi:MAG: hypothetical protein ACYCVY_12120 [Acidiferrobacteraceae bacterium]
MWYWGSMAIVFLLIVGWGLYSRWCDDRELRRQHRMLRKYDQKLDAQERAANRKDGAQ